MVNTSPSRRNLLIPSNKISPSIPFVLPNPAKESLQAITVASPLYQYRHHAVTALWVAALIPTLIKELSSRPSNPSKLGIATFKEATSNLPDSLFKISKVAKENQERSDAELINLIKCSTFDSLINRDQTVKFASCMIDLLQAFQKIDVAPCIAEFKNKMSPVMFGDVAERANDDFYESANSILSDDVSRELRNNIFWGWPAIKTQVDGVAHKTASALNTLSIQYPYLKTVQTELCFIIAGRLREHFTTLIDDTDGMFLSSPVDTCIRSMSLYFCDRLLNELHIKDLKQVHAIHDALDRFDWNKLYNSAEQKGYNSVSINTCWGIHALIRPFAISISERSNLQVVAQHIQGSAWQNIVLPNHRPHVPNGYVGLFIQDKASQQWHLSISDPMREMRSLSIIEQNPAIRPNSWEGLTVKPICISYKGKQVTLSPNDGMVYSRHQTFFPYFPRNSEERIAHQTVIDEINWRTRVVDSFFCREPRLLSLAEDQKGLFFIIAERAVYVISTPEKFARLSETSFLEPLSTESAKSLVRNIGITLENEWEMRRLIDTSKISKTELLPANGSAELTSHSFTSQDLRHKLTLGDYHNRFGYVTYSDFERVALMFGIERSDHEGQGRHPIYFNKATGAQYTTSPNYTESEPNLNRKLPVMLRLLGVPLESFLHKLWLVKSGTPWGTK